MIKIPCESMDLTAEERKHLCSFFPEGLVAIDLETTGLSPLVDRVIEVAAIKITPSETRLFSTLINPEIPIPAHTTAIHQITDEMVQEAPVLTDVLKSLCAFMGELPIVAHNAKFDLGFIVMAMQKNKIELVPNNIFCSCKLARQTHKEMVNHKLSTLVAGLDIPLLNHHRATDDAFASLKIFLSSLKRIENPLSPLLKRHGYLFSLADFKDIQSEDFPPHLLPLTKWVKEAAVIEIAYAGGSYKNAFRPLKLTSLLNSPDGSILYARCLWTNQQKSFKLKKIKELRQPRAEDIQKWLQK